MEQECMHTPVIADNGDTICQDCNETLCYGEPVSARITARVTELTRNGRLDGMTACDRCYMPKYGGKPCQWCQMYAAHPNRYYPTRPE